MKLQNGMKIRVIKTGRKATVVTLKGETIKHPEFAKELAGYDCEVSYDEPDCEDDFELFNEEDLDIVSVVREEKLMDKILFAKLRDGATIPSKREEDGAFDVYACFDEDYMVLQPHETKMIPTGLCSAFSIDYVAILKERGSNGSKGIGQRAGVVDSGYRGEWFVPLTNHNNVPLVIAKKRVDIWDISLALTGNKEITKDHILYPYEKAVCQCIMVEVPKLTIQEATVEEIQAISSERGTGMLGSSGK
ncbi:MAG: dUTP diphosphatase [Bacteroidales bacterium]